MPTDMNKAAAAVLRKCLLELREQIHVAPEHLSIKLKFMIDRLDPPAPVVKRMTISYKQDIPANLPDPWSGVYVWIVGADGAVRTEEFGGTQQYAAFAAGNMFLTEADAQAAIAARRAAVSWALNGVKK